MRWQEWLARVIAVLVIVGVPVAALLYQDQVVAKSGIHITAEQWQFVPNQVVVPRGKEVTLLLTSADVAHGFDDEGLHIEVPLIYPGHTVAVHFKADKPGNYPFVCDRICGLGHAEMSGIIVVR